MQARSQINTSTRACVGHKRQRSLLGAISYDMPSGPRKKRPKLVRRVRFGPTISLGHATGDYDRTTTDEFTPLSDGERVAILHKAMSQILRTAIWSAALACLEISSTESSCACFRRVLNEKKTAWLRLARQVGLLRSRVEKTKERQQKVRSSQSAAQPNPLTSLLVQAEA